MKPNKPKSLINSRKEAPYHVWVYYRGNAKNFIEKAAGTEDFGSGLDLESGLSDVSYFAYTSKQAIDMKNRILKVKDVAYVEIIHDDNIHPRTVRKYKPKK